MPVLEPVVAPVVLAAVGSQPFSWAAAGAAIPKARMAAATGNPIFISCDSSPLAQAGLRSVEPALKRPFTRG